VETPPQPCALARPAPARNKIITARIHLDLQKKPELILMVMAVFFFHRVLKLQNLVLSRQNTGSRHP
jgi:hypothetical protein